MRVALYARYSSDSQREASIDDQFEICRRYAERQGWTVVATHKDAAMSGASRFRPGYQQLLLDAEARRFDMVLVEALDRLGRKLADVADLHDRLQFAGVRLHAVNAGEITPMHVGLLGTMAQMYLTDLRDKTRRGQLGRVRQGKVAGGKAYGYDVVDGPDGGRGERRINDAEAAVVRRIFSLFAAGQSPRAIARQLNAEGVAGPDGRPWGDTTIRGQVERGTGLLNNALYVGRLEWNRCSYVKNPRTGRRVARPNQTEQREVVAVPELRIINDELWERVKARQGALSFEVGRDDTGNALNRANRRKFLLSGLLTCGVCGGGYTVMGKDRYGCSTHRSKGTCGNDRTIKRQDIEARVLGGLKERLLAPDLVREFITEVTRLANAQARESAQRRAVLDQEIGRVERSIAGLLKAIEDGLYTPAMKDKMQALERRRTELAEEAEQAPAPALEMVQLMPNLAEVYARKVAALEEALNDEAVKAEAAELLRAMIEKVVLMPRAGSGLEAQLFGELAGVLAVCDEVGQKREQPASKETGCQLSVVAGAGFEPATFRL
ncbi:recombinase family protein [Azospirillum sp. sgz302134]